MRFPANNYKNRYSKELTMRTLIIGALFLVTASQALAQDYKCVIEKYMQPGLPQDKQEYWERLFKGKEFTVDRRTGIMAGTIKNSYTTRPQIIDPGSKDNSFKVVTTLRREQGVGIGSNVFTLVINEFESTPKKPFVFLENISIYIGTCAHF